MAYAIKVNEMYAVRTGTDESPNCRFDADESEAALFSTEAHAECFADTLGIRGARVVKVKAESHDRPGWVCSRKFDDLPEVIPQHVDPRTGEVVNGSWIVIDRKTGAAVWETFDYETACQINLKKYRVRRAGDYLASLNNKSA